MRLSTVVTCSLLSAFAVNALSIPDAHSLSLRAPDALNNLARDELLSAANALDKRKGGGGKSGGGGGGGSKSGSGSKSSGSSSKTSSSSNTGGQTKSGSGTRPAYGGGRFYGGGATVPYQAGQKSRLGITPLFLLPAAALAIFPGLWLYGIYSYPYSHPYTFVNQTLQNATNPNGVNQTLPIDCLCQQYSVCGCDDNTDSQYLHDLVGNGSYAALNQSLVRVSDVNGTRTLVINGTLENGTTASGGTDSAAGRTGVMEYAGYWVVAAIVLYTVSFV